MKVKLEQTAFESLKKSMSLPHSSSILESFYPLALFGKVCGFFPLQNVLIGKSSIKKLHFHPFSYPVLYSIIINLFFYSLSFEATCDFWAKRGNIFKFSTDAFAIQIFLAVFFILRFTLHLLCIFRAPKVLECLKLLEAYDEYYSLENKTTLLNKYLIIYFIGTALNIVGNIVASFPGVWRVVSDNFYSEDEETSRYFIYLIIPKPEYLITLVYGIHMIAEAALFFSHCCITFIITGICDRISGITDKIIEISKDENYSFLKMPVVIDHDDQETLSMALWANQVHSLQLVDGYTNLRTGFQNNQYGYGKSILDDVGVIKKQEMMAMMGKDDKNIRKLKFLCSQYISLVDISGLLNDFAKETVAVFTAGSTVMLVALFYLITILLTQYVPVNSTRIKESGEICPIIFIAAITFLRLLNFINTGEKLKCDGYHLVTAIHRLYSSDMEASTVVVYFQQITTKLQLNLSAGGFFIVRRTVITSILGPVVTFIVILAQFRAADLQLHYNNNNKTTLEEL